MGELRNLRKGATWSMPWTSLMELNWVEEGSSCTRRAEAAEGLDQDQDLAAQGGAETLAQGPAPGQDLGLGPDLTLVTVPGPSPGLVAGTDPGAEADHEKERDEQNIQYCTKHNELYYVILC